MAYRNYGGGYRRPQQGGGGPGGLMNIFGALTPTVMYLIIINVVVFVVTMFIGRQALLFFALIPNRIVPFTDAVGTSSILEVWRLVTYMFMHADFGHILFNMLTLWWFGSPLEQIWGRKKFLTYYFLTGIGAGIVCVPFYGVFGGANIPIVGASGALFGILMAFALIYPNARVYLMFLFPMKVKWLVAFFMIMELAATMSYMGTGMGSGVASVAHFSGAIIGYFYLRRFMDIKAYYLRWKMGRKKRPYKVVRPPDDENRGPWLH